MLRPRSFLEATAVAALTVLLFLSPRSARGQSPVACLILRTTTYQQTDATTQQVTGYVVSVEVDFETAPGNNAAVTLTTPGGAQYAVQPVQADTYQSAFNFDTVTAEKAAFPDGSYTITVTGASPNSTTKFNATFGPDVAPVVITDFNALQAQPAASQSLQITWDPIPGANTGDYMEIDLDDSSGQTLATVDPDPVTDHQAFLPVYPGYHGSEVGLLLYASLEVSTSGGIQVGTGSGFGVSFPVNFLAPIAPYPPYFLVQPVSQIVESGAQVSLSASVVEASTYQWFKDGSPIPGATSAEYTVSPASLSDSGTYVLQATNNVGSATSVPVTITVPDTMDVTSFAGLSTLMPGAVDGTGSGAAFNSPTGVAVDSSGNVYVADSGNAAVRKITPTGTVTTLAGTMGSPGNVDGLGSAARFGNSMGALAIDSQGNLYLADDTNASIRMITPSGQTTTLASGFAAPAGVAVDASGDVFVACYGDDTIREITPSGAVSLFAGTPNVAGTSDGTGSGATLSQPFALTIDASGNLYTTGLSEHGIRKISPQGVVTSIFTATPSWGFLPVNALASDASGNLYFAGTADVGVARTDGTALILAGYPGNGYGEHPGIGAVAGFYTSGGLALAPDGSVYIADRFDNAVQKGIPIPGAPISVSWPQQSLSINQGGTVVLQEPQVAYQSAYSYINGQQANGLVSLISNAQPSDAGSYSVKIAAGPVETILPPITLTVSDTQDIGRLINVSVRAAASSGDQALITGFVVGGAGTSGNESVLIRASGPALNAFSVPDVLPDPQLQLFATSPANSLLTTNTAWGGLPAISTLAAQVGAFAWTDPSSHDCAVATALAPGSYTANITGLSGDSGVTLAEVYDATPAGTYTPSSSRIINVSARTNAGTGGNTLIGGFVIGGSTSKTVLIRATGPSLGMFGIGNNLPDPFLRVFDSSNNLIASNYGYNTGDPNIPSIAANVGAFAWAYGSADSAVVLTLPPGAYTAQVSSQRELTGIALIEVYEVP